MVAGGSITPKLRDPASEGVAQRNLCAKYPHYFADDGKLRQNDVQRDEDLGRAAALEAALKCFQEPRPCPPIRRRIIGGYRRPRSVARIDVEADHSSSKSAIPVWSCLRAAW